MKMNTRLIIGLTILTIMVLGSLILPLFTDVNPIAQGTYPKNLPPSREHPLGTNSLGQDIMWINIFAVRNSLLLGVSVSIVVTIISTAVGLTAGYLGGWADRGIIVITDSFIIIPTLPILIVLAALIKGSTSFAAIGTILVIFGWSWGARTVRSMALSLREREFINMAYFSGMNNLVIIFFVNKLLCVTNPNFLAINSR